MRDWIPKKAIDQWTEGEKGQYISMTMDYMLYLEQLLQETESFLDHIQLTTNDVGFQINFNQRQRTQEKGNLVLLRTTRKLPISLFWKLAKAYDDCITAKAEYDY